MKALIDRWSSLLPKYPFIVVVICFGIGIGSGWILHIMYLRSVTEPVVSTPVRLDGYRYISPLLLCDSRFDQNSDSLDDIKSEVQRYVDKNLNVQNNDSISVYFRYLKTGEEFGLNPNLTFYPASIKKIPLMIQYLKESETNRDLLEEKGTFVIDQDANPDGQYAPKTALVSGNKYDIGQLIEYMIKYSDNNSFSVLYQYLGANKADKIYDDMSLHFPNTYTSNEDYITTYQVSLFFRMLYNATYLNFENSEKALQMLSQVDYRNGLSKKIPADITVAHKYGISAAKQPNGKLVGEIHDCGVVYKSDNPYILCVMTKSQSTDIATLENIIADISSIAYQQAN